MSYSDSPDVEQHCEDIDPSAAGDWRRPRDAAKCSVRAFRMLKQHLNAQQKWTLAIMGGVWLVWTFHPAIPIPGQLYPIYGLLSLLLGAIVAKLHDIELEKLQNYSLSLQRNDGDDSDK